MVACFRKRFMTDTIYTNIGLQILSLSTLTNAARPQTSFNPDPHGLSNSRPSTGYRAADPQDLLEKLRAFSKTVEDNVEIYSQSLKPHLPAIGRFLIVVTFLEDALRIMTQWGDQIWYLQQCVIYFQTSFSPNSLTDIVIFHGAFLTSSSLLTLSYVHLLIDFDIFPDFFF